MKIYIALKRSWNFFFFTVSVFHMTFHYLFMIWYGILCNYKYSTIVVFNKKKFEQKKDTNMKSELNKCTVKLVIYQCP